MCGADFIPNLTPAAAGERPGGTRRLIGWSGPAGFAMAPIVPDTTKIKSFATEAAFERWLAANHARETELWLRIYKKASGVPSITPAQALDVVLCWGWIDGI